jgi:hypothetical protein
MASHVKPESIYPMNVSAPESRVLAISVFVNFNYDSKLANGKVLDEKNVDEPINEKDEYPTHY